MTTHRRQRPRPALQSVRRGVVLAAVLVLATGRAVPAEAPAGFEAPPVLRARALAPADVLRGPGYTVDDRVPVKGLLGHFTIRADVGTFEAHGVDMLRIRAAEVGAIRHLNDNSKTETFLKAAGTAAARPVEAAVNIVTNPVDTVKGLPGGVGRFFDRVAMGAERLEQAATAPGRSDADKAADVTQRAGSISADALGYEKERRDLAKQLQVDPYTTNPVLSKQLTDVAWVAFSGRLGVNTLISVFVPGATLLTATKIADDWVWDTPPGDLLKQAETKLADTGASPQQVQAVVQNRWYSLTVLSLFADNVAKLAPVAGRAEVVTLAGTVSTEDHARFMAEAVRMLVQHHSRDPLASVGGRGTVIGRTRTGAIVVPAPVDYVPWTKSTADFAARADLKAKERAVWLRGTASPRAKRELTARGWLVYEGIKPVWMK